MHNLRINEQRLWDTLMETAEFGKTAKGGIKRLTVSDLDRKVRDWFVARCEEAGCTVTVDDMGNIYAVRPGKDNSLPPIACGSHLDTQPTGGKYDGVLGVLSGLELVRTLNEAGVETQAPIMVVNWTNEEGSRFAPAMLASGVYAGAIDKQEAYALTDKDGLKFGEELERIGYKGDEPCGERQFGAFFEVHIEQGPILEAEDKVIGVVAHAQGQRWYDCTIVGRESHAGSTPMKLRRDALAAAARIILAVQEIALSKAPYGVGTVGVLTIGEPSRNVIPGTVTFTAEFRHPDDSTLEEMDKALREAVAEAAKAQDVEVDLKDIWHYPAVRFDKSCIDAVQSATDHLGYSNREMVSGAGHDACYVNRKAPTSMIFIPCKDGISHNEIESAEFDHCAAGANVLLHAVLAKAGV
ncbi:Zn-dependent hydrolase [Inquilinus sp. CAU 1745]|uniref:Zn-dependent hydrolase n=1 Tax=Inquilinus sp. CAU 1745 TaxID=3140369 RepID=UPI00325B067F